MSQEITRKYEGSSAAVNFATQPSFFGQFINGITLKKKNNLLCYLQSSAKHAVHHKEDKHTLLMCMQDVQDDESDSARRL